MSRLVVLNHFPVLPARIGGQQAVLGLAAGLAAYQPTELVWTQRKTAHSSTVPVGGVSLKATAVPNRWLQRQLARWLRHGLGHVDTDIGSLLCAGGNRALVRHLLDATADGDVLLLAHPWLWPAVQRVLARRRLRLVYDAHNVEHRLKQQSLRPGRVSAWVVERVRRAEAQLVARADLTLACTQRDAETLAVLGGVPASRLVVGSKGIAESTRADAVALARGRRAPGRVAVFVGSNHPPNNEAARWILEVLAPACPQWQFLVAGQCGPAAGVKPATPNAKVLGAVDDLLALMARADVALNPMESGSGINMKLFEYLQCGLPVLSTPFGARGFEALEPSGIVRAEREGFAAALEALVADPARHAALGAAGTACVRANFIWPVVARRVHEAILALP
jgi:glycosyltransferase involved in cell wall biosynthesis